VDVAAWEARLRGLADPAAAGTAAPRCCGQALAGKVVRGAGAHGQPVHVLGLAQHTGLVVAQTTIARTANAISAAPGLLAGRDRAGTVTTLDAQLTQRTLARQIRAQGGHELLVVKPTQPSVFAAIATLLARPPWTTTERATA
jgi:hypothetical protein